MTRTLGIMMLLATASIADAEGRKLPSLPDKEGFASPFAGVSHGTLLVAGGANFPDKRPWEGGTKIWYDAVFALDKPDGEWKKVGMLPRPLAYGISATYGETVICAGGSDAKQHYANVFRLEWKDGKLIFTPLPDLPRPVANACGALVGDVLFVAGGQEKPDSTTALKTVFALNLADPTRWQECDPIPGPARILATAAAFDGTLWIASGAELFADKDGVVKRTYLKDAYRYVPKNGWKRVADLPCSIVAAPSPAPTDDKGFFILGGDAGTHVGFTPPEKHPGFRTEILRYDVKADKWSEHGKLPAARVTVPLVRWNDLWVMPSGEVKPGIRSPEVWSVEIKK